MSETTTDKIDRAERLLREAQEELRLTKRVQVTDPCRAEIGGVTTRLVDPSVASSNLVLDTRAHREGAGQLSWIAAE